MIRVTSSPAPQTDGFELTGDRAAFAQQVLRRYPEDRKASAIIPLLDLAQRENGGWLSMAAKDWVAAACGVAPIRVYEVASFYTMFYERPMGEHIIQVCRTTPCWLRGADGLTKACKDHLGIGLGETTADRKFSLVEVECLGACVNAPMVQINDDYFEDLDASKMVAVLDALAANQAPGIGSQVGRDGSAPEGQDSVLQGFDPTVNAGRVFPDYSTPAEA